MPSEVVFEDLLQKVTHLVLIYFFFFFNPRPHMLPTQGDSVQSCCNELCVISLFSDVHQDSRLLFSNLVAIYCFTHHSKPH